MYGVAFAGALAVLTSLASMTASAAELKALITNGMKPVVAELGHSSNERPATSSQYGRKALRSCKRRSYVEMHSMSPCLHPKQ